MRCYYHPEQEAVGICKSCNKGICRECAIDIGNGIACKDTCEDEVKAINEITALSKKAFQKTGTAYSRGALVFLFLGISFVAFGIIEPQLRLFMIIVGAIMLLGAALYYLSGRSLANKNNSK